MTKARRFAGFSWPPLQPEQESPEEAHPRRHIDKGHGAIGETIEEAGAWQFGRRHKEALKYHSCIRYSNTYNVCKRTNGALGGAKGAKTGGRPAAESLFGLR
jgi:hypothetical protein